jgi:hypothetical protein
MRCLPVQMKDTALTLSSPERGRSYMHARNNPHRSGGGLALRPSPSRSHPSNLPQALPLPRSGEEDAGARHHFFSIAVENVP